MDLNNYKTEFTEDFLTAESAKRFSMINYHGKNKSLYLQIWNEGIAPAITEGKCYCTYELSCIDDIKQREDIKEYFENLGYNVKIENGKYVEIYW